MVTVEEQMFVLLIIISIPSMILVLVLIDPLNIDESRVTEE